MTRERTAAEIRAEYLAELDKAIQVALENVKEFSGKLNAAELGFTRIFNAGRPALLAAVRHSVFLKAKERLTRNPSMSLEAFREQEALAVILSGARDTTSFVDPLQKIIADLTQCTWAELYDGLRITALNERDALKREAR